MMGPILGLEIKSRVN